MAIIETTQLGPNSKTLARETDAGFGIKRMAATLSHELRTPLNAIVGSISLLERKFPEGSHDRVHIDRLKRNSRHLVAMLDDVLELLRADSGQFAVSPGMQHLCVVVDEVLAGVELHAGDPRVANRQHCARRAAVRDWGSRMADTSLRDAQNAY